MKKIINYLAIPFLFVILSTCSKSPLCWGENKNKGIIEGSIDFGTCFYDFPENEYIIKTEIEMDSIYSLVSYQNTGCEKPEVDFEKHTLLGQYASGRCEVKYVRDVEKDSNNKCYIYIVKVRDCGTCEKMGFSMNWVLVPKLPNDWSVKFRIK